MANESKRAVILDIQVKGLQSAESGKKIIDELIRKAESAKKTEIKPRIQTDEAEKKLSALDRAMERWQQKSRYINKLRLEPTATLKDLASGTIRKLEGHLDRLSGKAWKITVNLADKASSAIGRIFDVVTSPLAALGAGVGVVGAGGYMLKLAGEAEQAGIAFETMLGSKEKADRFLNDLTTFAVKTPFEMGDLRDASKRMLAFGFASDEIIPKLTAIGDAASGLGLGREGINRITLALGQMKAKAKVSGDEMLQMTEAGIPAWDILAKAMGVSTAQVMKLSEKGLIPAKQAIDALIEGMEERFPHMMDKQSRTMMGLMSTIKDFLNLKIFGAFGEGMRQGILPTLTSFTDALTNNEERAKRLQGGLIELGRSAGQWLSDKLENAGRYMDRLFENDEFKNASFGGKIKFIFDDAMAGFKKWLQEGGQEQLNGVAGVMVDILSTGIQAGAPRIADAALTIGVAVGKAMVMGYEKALADSPLSAIIAGAAGGAALGSVVPGVGTVAGAGVGAASGLVTWGIKQGVDTISSPYSASSSSPSGDSGYEAFRKLKGYATGGILDRPHIGMVAEDGPEAIIPLNPRRRDRALGLWQKAGEALGIPMHANGGLFGRIGLASAASSAVIADSTAADDSLWSTIGSAVKEAYTGLKELTRFESLMNQLNDSKLALKEMGYAIRTGESILGYASRRIAIGAPGAIAGAALDVLTGDEKTKALFGGTGSVVGGLGGTEFGAMVGTAISPGMGTILGSILGGAGGAIMGRFNGEWASGLMEEDLRQRIDTVVNAIAEPLQNRLASLGTDIVQLASFGIMAPAAQAPNLSIPVTAPVQIQQSGPELDYEAIANQVGWQVAERIRQVYENSTTG
ncbi:tape measure protein [Heliobacillus mobilis]|uniref:Tape measure protein n=1 Tax=Heliobacterium mobile TaxID=28064 RepID=A0A6I3SDI2_HELMO|nr:tape measure protein [Heliobacterium mobile]MTV47765.1 tape measure protein [Heliobacterium mobile]